MSDLISREAAEVYLRESLFGAGCSVEQVEAGLYCLRALPAASAVKVKPLVWVYIGVEAFSNSPFGTYLCAEVDTDHGKQWAFWQPDADTDYVDTATGFSYSADDAKAAAQADYEARILVALEGGAA